MPGRGGSQSAIWTGGDEGVSCPARDPGTPGAAQGLNGLPFYPAAELRTSATQLARFLMMFAQHGQYRGVRISKDATVDEMRRIQFPALEPTQGLVWFTYPFSPALIGHSGGYYGVGTEMGFDPQSGSGYVLLSNGGQLAAGDSDAAIDDAWIATNAKLAALAEALP